MKKLLVIGLVLLGSFVFVKAVNAQEVSLTVNECGCQTPTPVPTPTPTQQPTETPVPTTVPSNPPSSKEPDPAGAPICTATVPTSPVVTSVVRKSTSATLTWNKVTNANHYLIFYGTKPGSEEFGVPDTGNVTTFTINDLNPRLKYYFDVRSVNDCMPSQGGQVLGASTSKLAATSSDLVLPRAIISVIAAGVIFFIVKKNTI